MTDQEYFDQFHGIEEFVERPLRKEWEICGLHVEHHFYYGGTGSSSDDFDGYEVFNKKGGRLLLSLECPFEDLERAIPLQILRLKQSYQKKIREAQDKLAGLPDMEMFEG